MNPNTITTICLLAALSCSESTSAAATSHHAGKTLPALINADKETAPSFVELLRNAAEISPDELKNKLRYICLSDPSERTRQEAAYVLARLLQKEASPDGLKQALSLYDRAAKIGPLWERCQWHISECAQALGEERLVRQALETIAERSPAPETKAQADYGLAQSYLRAGETQLAKESFMSVRRAFPESAYALGSSYYTGEMLIDAKATQTEALELFRTYLTKSPDGHFATTIMKRMLALADFQPSKADHGLFAQVSYDSGQWQDALDHWAQSAASELYFPQSICLSHLHKTSDALDAFNQGLKARPNDALLPQAANLVCSLLDKDQTIALWNDVVSAKSKYSDIALWNLAVRAEKPESLAYWKELVDKYPHSEYAAESQWWLIWNDFKQGDFSAALASSQAAQKKYADPKMKARFAFWRGKISEHLGQKTAAKTFYNDAITCGAYTYYGHRAQARLSALGGNKDRIWNTTPARGYPDLNWKWPDISNLVSASEIAKQDGPTVAILCRLEQADECLQILPAKGSPRVRAWLFSKLNMPLDAISTAAVTLDSKPENTSIWQMGYPLLYAKYIAPLSKEKNIDPLLVHALIREESRYNPNATSHSNALGLMQLLPSTAFGIASKAGVTAKTNDDVYIPANNLALGTTYLSGVLSRFSGNAMFAVASYNGGPNAVAYWVTKFRQERHPDWDVFVEDIPLKETRNYVRKVFSSFWNYEAIYTQAKAQAKTQAKPQVKKHT